MPSIRQAILDILSNRKAATALELSRALDVTPANIRHHLRNLEHDGLVTRVGIKPASGRGRPTQVFRPTNLGSNLERLVGAILTVHLNNDTPEKSVAQLREIAHHLAAGEEPPEVGQHITQRLFHAIKELNDQNYQARWEARANAPVVILGHCPYRRIVDAHPEICTIDSYLIERLLAEKVTQVARLEHDNQGVPFCAFKLGE